MTAAAPIATKHKTFSLARVTAIASNTLLELIRLKVFYFLLLFALLIIGISFFTSKFTFQEQFQVLKDVSLVREIARDGVVRFDPNLDEHHHFICRKCGRVEDLPWDAIPPIDVKALEGQQRVESFDITLYGVCAGCEASA